MLLFTYKPDHWYVDREDVVEAAKQTGHAFQHASEEPKGDREVATEAANDDFL